MQFIAQQLDQGDHSLCLVVRGGRLDLDLKANGLDLHVQTVGRMTSVRRPLGSDAPIQSDGKFAEGGRATADVWYFDLSFGTNGCDTRN